MNKKKIKELITIAIIATIDILITCIITNYFGIQNIVLLKTNTILFGDITWEVLICLSLFGISCYVMDKIYNHK